MEPILQVKNLKTHFKMHDHIVRAVDGLSFDLYPGETLGIVGESGCGKSMTSMSIMRLVPSPPGDIVDGEILLEGKDLLKLSEEEMRSVRGNDIGMIFQEPMTSLNPLFSVGDQISEVLMLHRGMTRKEAMKEAARLLDLVGIPRPEQRVHEYPFQLSGGLRQRVVIAMAIACEPKVLIADEPTTALDVTIQAQILQVMKQLKDRINAGILFITHDLAVIASFADRVMVMYAGVCVEMASIQEIFNNPLHPYTQGLIASIPAIGTNYDETGKRKVLKSIPGSLPNPKDFPKGCRFAPRSEVCPPRCYEEEPPLVEVSPGHFVRHFGFVDINTGKEA